MTLKAHGFSAIPTTEPIAIPADDHGDKVLNLIVSGGLADEIRAVMTYAKNNVSETARGIACPVRTPEAVRTLMSAQPDGSIMASGSVQTLIIEENAVNTLDAARVKRMLTDFDTLAAFKKAIGPIKINFDVSDQSTLKQARRLNKDAEIQALCLLIYWMQNEDVTAAGSDLIFEYMHGGVGPRAATAALRHINEEETARKVTTEMEGRREEGGREEQSRE